MAVRRSRGQPVLPLAFGEAGLPVHPALREALAASAAANSYGPVAGHQALRSAAAGYWARRGLRTSPDQVVCGPGSKPLLYGLLLAIGGGLALPQPCWVSYAAQATLIGVRPHWCPRPRAGRDIPTRRPRRRGQRGGRRRTADPLGDNHPARQPDRPGGVPGHGHRVVRGSRRAPAGHHQRRDLPRPDPRPGHPAAQPRPGGPGTDRDHHRRQQEPGAGRLADRRGPDARGPARPPAAPLRCWGSAARSGPRPPRPSSTPPALAFTDPPPITGRIAASRALHAQLAAAVAAACTNAGLIVPAAAGRLLRLPRLRPVARSPPRSRHQVTTSTALARLLLRRYGAATLPGSAFGESPSTLRLRLATALLYGDSLPAARSSTHRPRPDHAPLDRRRPDPARRDTRRPGQLSPASPAPRGRCT